MLSQEFRDFYHAWRQKAEGYVDDGGMQWAFDRFFTLYVLYNRLYVELTLERARSGDAPLRTRLERARSFPDTDAATHHVREYIGSRTLMRLLEAEPTSAEAIRAATALLAGPVNGREFFINLGKVYGNRQPRKDAEHLAKFQAHNANDRADAVLQFVYAVRINLFHGHKTYEGVQLEVLHPANALLSHLNRILFERMSQ